MQLKGVSPESHIAIRASNFYGIAIELEMLVKITHRFEGFFTIEAGHTFWTMVFDVLIKLK